MVKNHACPKQNQSINEIYRRAGELFADTFSVFAHSENYNETISAFHKLNDNRLELKRVVASSPAIEQVREGYRYPQKVGKACGESVIDAVLDFASTIVNIPRDTLPTEADLAFHRHLYHKSAKQLRIDAIHFEMMQRMFIKKIRFADADYRRELKIRLKKELSFAMKYENAAQDEDETMFVETKTDKTLIGRHDILAAIGASGAFKIWRSLKRYNKENDGPIVIGGKGKKPYVCKSKLVSWWNGLFPQKADKADALIMPPSKIISGELRPEGRAMVAPSIAGRVQTRKPKIRI